MVNVVKNERQEKIGDEKSMEEGKNSFEELNIEQQEAVFESAKKVILIAGPGSGKTKTLVAKTTHLFESGIKTQNMLLLTFTNKAAREMKKRIEKSIGPSAQNIFAGTFHSFANTILRRFQNKVGRFSIIDDEESSKLIGIIVEEEFGKGNKISNNTILNVISLCKLKKMNFDEISKYPEYFHLRDQAENLERIAKKYETEKNRMKVMDFDDLLVNFLKLLKFDEEIRKMLQNQYTHVFVDEFQDTDKIQGEIIEQLITEQTSIMVVGDDFQSIYSFRGAEYRNMFEFRDKHLPKVIILKRNYRSTKKIVELINETITKNRDKFEKELYSQREEGEMPKLAIFTNKTEEALFIKNEIKERIAKNQSDKIAVLFRSSYLSSDLELELTKEGIPYEMRGGLKFFEKKHIKDIVALLKFLNNPNDHISGERVLLLFPKVGKITARKALIGIDEVTKLIQRISKGREGERNAGILIEKITGLENQTPALIIDQFVSLFYKNYLKEHFEDFGEREEEIETLLNLAIRYQSVSEMLDSVTLDAVEEKEEEKRVILSTIHQAKGLEWETVFVMGLANGLFPSSRSSDIEEERRLFYVACSRAKNELILCYPQTTGRFYNDNFLEVSVFVSELKEERYIKMFN